MPLKKVLIKKLTSGWIAFDPAGNILIAESKDVFDLHRTLTSKGYPPHLIFIGDSSFEDFERSRLLCLDHLPLLSRLFFRLCRRRFRTDPPTRGTCR